MKTKSRQQRESSNRRYDIGVKQTPIGPAYRVVWSNEVVNVLDNVPHMLGVKLHTGEVIWCRDTDEGANQLAKDRRANGGR